MGEVVPRFKVARPAVVRDTATVRQRARAQANGYCQADGMHADDCPVTDAGRAITMFEAHHVRPTRPDFADDSDANLLWVHSACHRDMIHKYTRLARSLGLLRANRDIDPLFGIGVERALAEGWFTVADMPPLLD